MHGSTQPRRFKDYNLKSYKCARSCIAKVGESCISKTHGESSRRPRRWSLFNLLTTPLKCTPKALKLLEELKDRVLASELIASEALARRETRRGIRSSMRKEDKRMAPTLVWKHMDRIQLCLVVDTSTNTLDKRSAIIATTLSNALKGKVVEIDITLMPATLKGGSSAGSSSEENEIDTETLLECFSAFGSMGCASMTVSYNGMKVLNQPEWARTM